MDLGWGCLILIRAAPAGSFSVLGFVRASDPNATFLGVGHDIDTC